MGRITHEQELAEAREQLAATSEILRVIARSPNDAQPVFDTIAAVALRLCRASVVNVLTFDGGLLHIAALANILSPEGVAAVRRLFPRPPGPGAAASMAVASGRVVSIPDVLEDPHYEFTTGPNWGVRSVLGLPLLRESRPIGALVVCRPEPGPFPDRQVALLTTFAEQAVIAIENVRLVRALEARNRDLAEALEQQTATSDILRVISRSPTDAQPVFDTIAKAAMRLCNAGSANVFTFDGELLQIGTIVVAVPEADAAIRSMFPRPPDRGSVASRAVLMRSVIAIPDVTLDPDYAVRGVSELGFRSVVGVPLLRDGAPIGAIAIGKPDPGPFPPQQVALLQTFADQAVIAIENSRLFRELQSRTQELQEALERQGATSQVLSAISRSPTELEPVLDTIVQTASRLVGADHAGIMQLRDGRFMLAAACGASPEFVEFLRNHPPALDHGTLSGRTVLERRTVYIEDTRTDPRYAWREAAERGNYRTVLGAPLLRQGEPIGVLWVAHQTVRAFMREQVALITTFADQAVIAIENVRLFKELQARTTQLTRTVEQLQALAEVGQAVSSTLDLETVLATIVSRARELAGMDGGVIYEYDEARQAFALRATDRLPDELTQALRDVPMHKGEGAVGRVAILHAPVHISDIADAGLYQSRVREMLLRHGYRSLLAVPLLREDRLLGGLVVHRRRAGEFEPQVIDLLKAFATQSALAIQNARLFQEIEEKSLQLEAASRHKSAFLANMSHELRTPLNAIIGFARIVMRRTKESIDAKQYENLEKILGSAQHLLSLINAVLDLAKVEAGKIEVQAAEVQLAELLEQCARSVEPLLADGVALQRDFSASLPPLWTDGEKLRQIVFNLLSNAAKFTAAGHVRISARQDGEAVAIAVADTGIGIPADKLEAVFEEFEQVQPNGALTQGTGLGLAISRRLARLIGGELAVESALGAGSTFTLALPLRHGEAPR